MLKKLSPTLKRITHKLNGHFSFFDEDDLFQEALVHLWLTFREGKISDKTDSYLLQGCYFHLKNYLRKALDKAKIVSLYQLIDEDDTVLEEIIAAEGRGPYEAIDSGLLEQTLPCALTERERSILSLSLEGLTTREMGKRLGISHVMVTKIRKRMREKLPRIFIKEKFGVG